MDASAIREMFGHVVLVGCLWALAGLVVAGVLRWLSRLPGRVGRTAGRIGWPSVLALFTLGVGATISGSPTRDDKLDDMLRRGEERRENAAWSSALGLDLLVDESIDGLRAGASPYEGGDGGTGGLPGMPSVLRASAPPREGLPSVRPPTPSDYAAGVALSRIGTGEVFDFSPPEGAETCGDWLRFGASRDWFRCGPGTGDGKWGVRLGTNSFDVLTVFSHGALRPSTTDTATFVSPLEASLGVVPAANWSMIPRSGDEEAKSLFWTLHTPSNTFVATWSDVLLDRASDRPVSFQAEFLPGGGVVFRYDLSRLPEDVVTNLVVGISNGGAGRVFTALARSTTSLRWAWLDPARAGDPDPDGDRVPTEDEVLVHGTDPYSADSDGDGLSDFAEIAAGGNPLDPYSNGSAFSDGFAAALGGLDPLSCSPGSTNTVYEHLLYSGTVDGSFAPPVSDAATAVLRVTATGEGVVDLLVDGIPVPLLGAAGGRVVPLALPRGRRLPLRLRANGPAPALAFASDDFAAGELPTDPCGEGWIAFPRTDATPACFHSEGGTRLVSVPACDGLPDLRATWESVESMYLEISNAPPRAAVLRSTAEVPWGTVRYTLSHPDRLFGGTVFLQTVRTCPEPEPPPPPPGPEPPDSGDGDGDEEDPHHRLCVCGCGCEVGDGGSCSCGCAAEGSPTSGLCTCRAGGGTDGADGPEDAPLGDTDSDDPAMSRDVLVLHRTPADARTIRLDVPGGRVEGCTCPCPEHRTSHVSLWSSSRLAVEDSSGGPFSVAYETQDVVVRPVCPSAEPGDARLAFSRNGTLFETRSFTVLGLDVRHPTLDLDGLAARDPSFGVPMVVAADAERGLELLLRTDVDLGFGRISLAFEGATAPFTAWRWAGGAWIPLCSSSGGVTAGAAAWRAALGVADAARDTPIRVTAPVPGSCTLVFSYEGTVGGRRVACAKRRRITAVAPPLLADHDRNGGIDGADAALQAAGAAFRFWFNEDVDKGDFVGQNPDVSPNWDADPALARVKGRLDLVNLFPVRIDVSAFRRAWGGAATFRLRRESPFDRLRYCRLAGVSPDRADAIQTEEVLTASGGPLETAALHPLDPAGEEIGEWLDEDGRAMLAFMAGGYVDEWSCPELVVELGGRVVYCYTLPLSICSVREMYNWVNSRHLSDETEARPTWLGAPSCGSGKTLVFLHGANVGEDDAGKWGDALYKRLWWAGADVDFYNVDWRSDIGSSANYHENASNAFAVAEQLASTIAAIPGQKTIMAHSLGNMVVSSMIQDHGLQVEKYLMFNSAVPAEAYDPDPSLRVPQLVHPDWEEYPTNTWTASYHSLFDGFPDDDRRHLGWPGRFVDVAQYAVNFYSTGDEVLELAEGNSLWLGTGTGSFDFGHMSWHKQELFKGRGIIDGLGGTDWSGWRFNGRWRSLHPAGREWEVRYTPEQAAGFSSEQLRVEPVFYPYPESMTNSVIPLLVRAAHLTKGIPALTPAAGFSSIASSYQNFNLDDLDEDNGGVVRPNNWPVRNEYEGQWLHSDMKDVAYFYNFLLYRKIVEKGTLK